MFRDPCLLEVLGEGVLGVLQLPLELHKGDLHELGTRVSRVQGLGFRAPSSGILSDRVWGYYCYKHTSFHHDYLDELQCS